MRLVEVEKKIYGNDEDIEHPFCDFEWLEEVEQLMKEDKLRHPDWKVPKVACRLPRFCCKDVSKAQKSSIEESQIQAKKCSFALGMEARILERGSLGSKVRRAYADFASLSTKRGLDQSICFRAAPAAHCPMKLSHQSCIVPANAELFCRSREAEEKGLVTPLKQNFHPSPTVPGETTCIPGSMTRTKGLRKAYCTIPKV